MFDICLSLCGAGIPSSNWVQPFNVSQSWLEKAIHDTSNPPPSPVPFFMFFLCTSLHSGFTQWFETCQYIYSWAGPWASSFRALSFGSLDVDLISVSVSLLFCWHVVGLSLPSPHETWWGVCLFHLCFRHRNIFLFYESLPRPRGLFKAFNSLSKTAAARRTTWLLQHIFYFFLSPFSELFKQIHLIPKCTKAGEHFIIISWLLQPKDATSRSGCYLHCLQCK